MSVGAFTDKEHQPTMRAVLTVIGYKRRLWQNLTKFIANNYQVRGEFKSYGKNYGWAVRYRKGGKALVSLYPGKESFTAQIVLGQKGAKEALNLQLGRNVRKTIQEAREFPEGRWLFIKVGSDQDLQDVQELMAVKSGSLKKRE